MRKFKSNIKDMLYFFTILKDEKKSIKSGIQYKSNDFVFNLNDKIRDTSSPVLNSQW